MKMGDAAATDSRRQPPPLGAFGHNFTAQVTIAAFIGDNSQTQLFRIPLEGAACAQRVARVHKVTNGDALRGARSDASMVGAHGLGVRVGLLGRPIRCRKGGGNRMRSGRIETQ